MGTSTQTATTDCGYMLKMIVIAIFGLVIAIIFSMYPQSVLAVWVEVPIAILLGYLIYKKAKMP